MKPDLCIFLVPILLQYVITYSHANKGLLLLLLPGHYQNSCPPRNNRERQQMPRYQPSLRDNHRRNVSGPYPALNDSGCLSVVYLGTAVAASHHELPSYVSYNYDSVD